MSNVLPQQRLLLELLIMSGNIGVPSEDNGTLLFRTLIECRKSGWITLNTIASSYAEAAITQAGRRAIKDRRATIRTSS